ncbi:MAG: quinoprotein dehydrogenase-associated SoxYZ-like carrier [Pseudomonadota bacterium]
MRLLAAALMACLLAAPAASASETWGYLRDALFEGRAILDGDGVVEISAPARAQQAGRLPVEITTHLPQTVFGRITRMTVLIDENPAPVAAVVELGEGAARGTLGLHLRINENSDVRVVAETADGRLFMAKTFVKGAGGCADGGYPSAVMAERAVGDVLVDPVRTVAVGEPADPLGLARRGERFGEVSLALRHPNDSGFMLHPIDRTWIPVNIVEELEISLAGVPVMRLEGSISLSTNPDLRFLVRGGAGDRLDLRFRDTDGHEFERSVKLRGEGA